MKVFIYGFNGNMARRYRSILGFLDHQVAGEDVDGNHGDFKLDDADAVIVATPTETHLKFVWSLLDCRKPILCEKPISKNLDELRKLMSECAAHATHLQMVSQYDHLVDPGARGDTSYSYFKTGPDGMPWDCLQIIWHAKGEPLLSTRSPVWSCKINGRELSSCDMDHAYVDEIKIWLERPRNDIGRILDSHEKVAAMEAEWPPKS